MLSDSLRLFWVFFSWALARISQYLSSHRMWLCQSGNCVLFNTGDSTPEMGDKKKNQEWNVKGSCSGLNMQYGSKLIQEYFPWFLMMEYERYSHWPWNTALERNYISLKHTRIEELEEKYCALILSFWPQQRPPQLSSHVSTHTWTLVRSIALKLIAATLGCSHLAVSTWL